MTKGRYMTIGRYIGEADKILKDKREKEWLSKLADRASEGIARYCALGGMKKREVLDRFNGRVRTEEIKAWYSSPDSDSLFQGTSISSLTIPCELKDPLELKSIDDLETAIADSYIALHDRHARTVRDAIVEDVSGWIKEGLYYGIALSSKIISQAFGLKAVYKDVVFSVKGHVVDPHEIAAYPEGVRRSYFGECLKKLDLFDGMRLEQRELESSLVLADISKPKMAGYKDKIILAPVRCNEIAAVMSRRVAALIRKKSAGRINPRSIAIVIYDTDTPYTYHRIMGHGGHGLPEALPGLIVLGSSGSIDAFRWLYAYRLSLIAQKMMKSSLYSEVHRKFVPFVFFGVLVPRDADILLDMNNLDLLRYKGNYDPKLEFGYIVENIIN